MEQIISAITGDFTSRLISSLVNKFSDHVCSEEKLKRLEQLLLRVHMVVEEADGRYITKSGMLMKLKELADAMYQGHHILDMFRCRTLVQENTIKEVSNPFPPLKRFRTIVDASRNKARYLDLHKTLGTLQTAVDHMAEFAVLLGGCERMSRRPYDAYLYIDNFMFGRHTEKQKLLNFLLEYNPPGVKPAVLPIVGGLAVGKKTLVAHVCADERVQSQFSSILHLNEDDLLRLAHSETLLSGKTLAVVEFVSDVNEKNWEEFYTFVAPMKEGSKVITISRLRKSEKLGTVKPILLNSHSYEELSYLFKTLAFGSANPEDHPRLVQMAEEFALQFQLRGSLVTANTIADVLRRNLAVNFWFCILNRCIAMAEKNFSLYGDYPKILSEQGRRIDMTNFALSPAAPLHIIPCIGVGSATTVRIKDLPRMTFGELLLNPSVRPKGEFSLVIWESRLPPYTSFVHFAPYYAQDTPLSRRKRRGVPS